MLRCPNCGAEIVYEDTYIIGVRYKIVGNKKGKTVIKQDKPNPTNFIRSRLVCLGCRATLACERNEKGEITELWMN